MMSDVVDLRLEPPVATIRLIGEIIDAQMVDGVSRALDAAEAEGAHVAVLEGSAAVFCLGADVCAPAAGGRAPADPDALYGLWLRLSRGPFVSVAHARGRVNAGGVGFVAACDIAIADAGAEFSLSELLFGLQPACVAPFLIRRVGAQRAHFLTLSTLPITAAQALAFGLVDMAEDDSAAPLRRLLTRLRRLSRAGVVRYKSYRATLDSLPETARAGAVAANREMFGDPAIVSALDRFARTGMFPWED
jgi:polyketide biosynthesis enoyl-CoA hydratase PksH